MGSDSGADSGSEAENKKGPSLLDNFVEDLTSVFNGTANSPHSAHDVRSANAMFSANPGTKENPRSVEDYLPGGTYGPRGGSYSPRAHQQALAEQAGGVSASAEVHGETLGGATASESLTALSPAAQKFMAKTFSPLTPQLAEEEEVVATDPEDATGATLQLGASIGSTLSASTNPSGKPTAGVNINAAEEEPAIAQAPVEASIASPFTTSRADIAKTQAQKAQAQKEQARAQKQKEDALKAGLKGLAQQVEAAKKNAARKAAIAQEHHPAYGYTNRGSKLLSQMEQDIIQDYSARTGFSSRGLNLLGQYSSLPGTSLRSALSGLADWHVGNGLKSVGEISPTTKSSEKKSARRRAVLRSRASVPITRAYVDLLQRSVQQTVTREGLLGAAGLTSTFGPFVGLHTDWGKFNLINNQLDTLVSEEEEKKAASKLGRNIGKGVLFGAELGLLGGASVASGDKAQQSARQGKTAKAQSRAAFGSYGLSVLTDRLAKIGSVSTQLMKGVDETRNLLAEGYTAAEKFGNYLMNRGINLLEEKDDEKDKK